MPPVSFTAEIRVDGEGFRARSLGGTRQFSTQWIPQMSTQHPGAQLEPLNESDWSDGRGWGLNVDCSEGMMLPGPEVTSVALPTQPGADLEQFAEQDGHIYVVGGRYAYKIALGSGAVTADQDLGAAFLAVSVVPWKTSLIVGGRLTGNIWEKAAGGAWTQAMVGAAVQRGKMTTVWWNTDSPPLASLRLVGEVTPTSLSYVAANPRLDTDWKAPITLGAYPIRSMVANYTHAYAVTTGGLFDFGMDGNAPNLTPEVEHTAMDSNGKASLATDGYIYFNVGYTLKRVNVIGTDYARPEDCGWASQVPQQCPMSGYCTALAKYGRWIWAAVYDGTNTWVIKGRQSVQGDRVGPLTWFVAPIYVPGIKVTAMHVSGLVDQNPRLWMGCTDGTTRSLKWAHLPLDSAYRDLKNSRLYRFSSSFQYDSPEEDHGDDSLPKFLRELVGEGETLGNGPQIALSVATDGSAAYTPIGTYRANPRATVRPAATLLPGRYTLRHSGTGTSTTPPVLRKESRRVIPRPDLLQIRNYQIVVGQEVRFSDGAIDGRSRKTAQRTMERLQKAGPVSFRDENGADLTVLMLAGQTMQEVEANLGDADARRVLTVDCQVAVLATQGTSFKWNDGTRYGTAGKVWGG